MQVVPKSTNAESKLYCKQKLILFNHWRDEDELKGTDESWLAANNRQNNLLRQTNFMVDFEQSESENQNDHLEDDNENNHFFNHRDWMAISAAMPNALPKHVGLGFRDIDLNHNWKAAFHKYPNLKQEVLFIEKIKKQVVMSMIFAISTVLFSITSRT